MKESMTKTRSYGEGAQNCFAVPGASSIIDIIDPASGKSWIEGETLEQIRLRYPGAVIMPLEEHCRAKAARQETPIAWNETTEEQYQEMLEVSDTDRQLGRTGNILDRRQTENLLNYWQAAGHSITEQ